MVRSIFLWVYVLTFGIFSSTFADTRYSITDLGIGDGYKSVAHDINDQGQILFGYYVYNPDGDHFVSCLWDNGTITTLETQYGPINNSGQMIGDGFWDHGVITEIHGDFPSVIDLNDSGQYVGSVLGLQNPDLGQLAALWSGPQAEPTILKDTNNNALHGSAYAINNSGQVVGFTLEGAWIWNNGSAKALGEEYQVAFDINDSGQVIGQYEFDIEGSYLWQEGKTTVNLGSWRARSINNLGEIVGTSKWDSADQYAVLWDDGVYYNLNDLIPSDSGWNLQFASRNNNIGQIIGNGIINGEEHAFLLTPIPEPGTMALLLLGGAVMAEE